MSTITSAGPIAVRNEQEPGDNEGRISTTEAASINTNPKTDFLSGDKQ